MPVFVRFCMFSVKFLERKWALTDSDFRGCYDFFSAELCGVTQPLKSKWHVFEQSEWGLGAHLLSKHFRNLEWQDPRVSNFEQFSVFSMCYFAVIASFWVVIDRTNPFAEAKPVQDRKLVTVQCLVCHCFIILLWFVRKLAGCLQESVPQRTFKYPTCIHIVWILE